MPWITEVRKKYAFVLSFTGKYFFFWITLCFQISILIHLFSLDELISASSSLFVNAFIFSLSLQIYCWYKILGWQLFCVSFSFSTLNMSSHCFQASFVSDNKSPVYLIRVTLYLMSYVSFALPLLFRCLCPW